MLLVTFISMYCVHVPFRYHSIRQKELCWFVCKPYCNYNSVDAIVTTTNIPMGQRSCALGNISINITVIMVVCNSFSSLRCSYIVKNAVIVIISSSFSLVATMQILGLDW